MRGIEATAVYLPAFRIAPDDIAEAWGTNHARGIETKAVAGGDEDALTMAVAAGRRALDRSTVPRGDVAVLGFATTTPPLEEESMVPQAAAMLGLPDDVEPHTATQSPLAWAQLLKTALDADGPALLVVGDAPEGELATTDHRLGAGAVAFVVDDDAPVAVRDVTTDVGVASGIRYRDRGEETVESLDITTYERTAMRESVAAAVERLDVDADEVGAAALHQPNAGLPYRLARGLPFSNEAVARGTVVDRVGDAGAATVPLGLVAALAGAEAGEATVAADFGGGGATIAFAFEGGVASNASAALDGGEELRYPEYLRKRGYVVDSTVAGGGVHVSLPTWQRSLDQRYRLVAGRCPACGALAFPPEGACPDCHERGEFEPVELPRRGTIRAVTVIGQGGAPPEFAGQQQRDGRFGVAIVEVEGEGGSVKLPVQMTDADPDGLAIGDEVVGEIRHVYSQESLPRYGLKFKPATESDEGA